MNIMPLAVIWAVLATVVLALALYRRSIAAKEDDIVHVNVDVTPKQEAVNKKLEAIDRWGKILTVIVVIYALVLLGLFLYSGWQNSGRIAS
jgi:uncharacterized membrane protein